MEMKQTIIRQRRGPAIKFTGSIIAKTEYTTHRGDEMRMEIHQTEGGALIAVSITDVETRADVIEPGDEMDMRCAVMDAFGWNERARTMCRDQLKWKFVREVP